MNNLPWYLLFIFSAASGGLGSWIIGKFKNGNVNKLNNNELNGNDNDENKNIYHIRNRIGHACNNGMFRLFG